MADAGTERSEGTTDASKSALNQVVGANANAENSRLDADVDAATAQITAANRLLVASGQNTANANMQTQEAIEAAKREMVREASEAAALPGWRSGNEYGFDTSIAIGFSEDLVSRIASAYGQTHNESYVIRTSNAKNPGTSSDDTYRDSMNSMIEDISKYGNNSGNVVNIAGHGSSASFGLKTFNLDTIDPGDGKITRQERLLLTLKPKLTDNAVIEIRACEVAAGWDGRLLLKRIQDLTGGTVVGWDGFYAVGPTGDKFTVAPDGNFKVESGRPNARRKLRGGDVFGFYWDKWNPF